jgi:hypothetical protein
MYPCDDRVLLNGKSMAGEIKERRQREAPHRSRLVPPARPFDHLSGVLLRPEAHCLLLPVAHRWHLSGYDVILLTIPPNNLADLRHVAISAPVGG